MGIGEVYPLDPDDREEPVGPSRLDPRLVVGKSRTLKGEAVVDHESDGRRRGQ